MGKAPRTNATACMAYQLPEEKYWALQQARDHLLLLARLTELSTTAGGEEVLLSRPALADCFQRLAGELDDIVRGVWWPSQLRTNCPRPPDP
ncbi:hypothetical protein GCM10027431_09900 [Lysobacter rhizosphaerae]